MMVWTRWSGITKTNQLPVEAAIVDARVIDDQQRGISTQGPGSNIAGWHNFPLLLPSDSKAVQLAFAVRRSTVIDFDVANPATPPLMRR